MTFVIDFYFKGYTFEKKGYGIALANSKPMMALLLLLYMHLTCHEEKRERKKKRKAQ
jgi:hypothetical protein